MPVDAPRYAILFFSKGTRSDNLLTRLQWINYGYSLSQVVVRISPVGYPLNFSVRSSYIYLRSCNIHEQVGINFHPFFS